MNDNNQIANREKSAVNIVFFGLERTPDLTFVEVENDDGQSIRIGEWSIRSDGFHNLRIVGETEDDK